MLVQAQDVQDRVKSRSKIAVTNPGGAVSKQNGAQADFQIRSILYWR